ncbi:transcriptional regulator [Castellaniella sp.]|uniref:transcriptional regulator n=1 Tax=Castellaniella sp. TaxID=1955812 RepID=UPI00356B2193
MPDFQPVREACTVMGGMTPLAKKLGLPVQVVSSWAAGTRPVPIIRCVEIEEITGGEVTRKQLRPDDWWQIWPELRGED